RVIPVIGAGVSSAAANLPSWVTLIKMGFEYAESRYLNPDLISKGRKHLEDNNFLLASNYLKKVLNAPSFPYVNWIKDIFEDPIIESDSLINSILDLSTSIIATTNYDTLLSSINTLNLQKFIYSDHQLIFNAINKKENLI
ncbi:hypothetical protein D0809_26495, partial [Flavobacterium circumlabens]